MVRKRSLRLDERNKQELITFGGKLCLPQSNPQKPAGFLSTFVICYFLFVIYRINDSICIIVFAFYIIILNLLFGTHVVLHLFAVSDILYEIIDK